MRFLKCPVNAALGYSKQACLKTLQQPQSERIRIRSAFFGDVFRPLDLPMTGPAVEDLEQPPLGKTANPVASSEKRILNRGRFSSKCLRKEDQLSDGTKQTKALRFESPQTVQRNRTDRSTRDLPTELGPAPFALSGARLVQRSLQ